MPNRFSASSHLDGTMAQDYSRRLLRVAVAQIAQNLGWHAVQSTPMELLTDVLERYILAVSQTTHRYSEQYGRTQPNLNDLGLAFREYNVNLTELEEYLRCVEPVPFVQSVPQFPVPKPNNLHFPNPQSRESHEREEHIHEHLPPIHPEWDEEIITQNGHDPAGPSDDASMQVSPLLPPGVGLGGEKRQLTSPGDMTPPSKKARILPEEAAHSQYEMKGVLMSTSGLLTPTRGQGKLPDPSTPPQVLRSIPGATAGMIQQIGMSPLAAPNPGSGSLRPSVISETIGEHTTGGDYEASMAMRTQRLDSSFEEEVNSAHEPISAGMKPLQPIAIPPPPNSVTKSKGSTKKVKDKKDPAKVRVKKTGDKTNNRTPKKEGKSPARGKSPKGANKKGSKLQTSLTNSPKTGIKSELGTPVSRTLNPARVPPSDSNIVPAKCDIGEDPDLEKLMESSDEDSESPQLVIAEDEAKQREFLEAQRARLASYEQTIDEVIARSMAMETAIVHEECVVEETVVSETWEIDEDQGRSQRIYDTIDDVIRQSTEAASPPMVPDVVEEMEIGQEETVVEEEVPVSSMMSMLQTSQINHGDDANQERIRRQSLIDDTIDEVVRGSSGSKVKDIYSFSDDDDDDFSAPPIPSIPISPDRKEPVQEIVSTPTRKEKKKSVRTKAKLKFTETKEELESGGDVKQKLKEKLMQQKSPDMLYSKNSNGGSQFDFGSLGENLISYTKEEAAYSSTLLSVLSSTATPLDNQPMVQPIRIGFGSGTDTHMIKKEEKDGKESKKDKKKKKNKDKEKDRDKKDKKEKKEKDKKEKSTDCDSA